MPNLGEIKSGFEIGESPTNNYIWAACAICGTERWVRFIKGHPKSIHCRSCSRANNHWGTGRLTQANGYIRIKLLPNDFFYSMAWSDGYVFEHRLVMAKHLGRCLHRWEIVHHKNNNPSDNSLDNLMLVGNDRHTQITILERKIKRLEEKISYLTVENSKLRQGLPIKEG